MPPSKPKSVKKPKQEKNCIVKPEEQAAQAAIERIKTEVKDPELKRLISKRKQQSKK